MVFDRTKIHMAVPAYDIDKIIGVTSGTINVAAPVAGAPDFGVKSATATFDTEFGDTCYPQGIFSYDGGVTWNDFGAMIPDLTTPANPVFQTVDCDASMIGGVLTVKVTNYRDAVHATSTPRTVLYKVLFVAKKTQGSIEPLQTEEILYYSSQRNYRKIFLDSTVPFNLAGTSTGKSANVIHSLGYVPKVRAFYQESSGLLRMLPIKFYSIEPRVTTTDVTFYQDPYWDVFAINGDLHYRIYLDD
jgi:hypothetical protein